MLIKSPAAPPIGMTWENCWEGGYEWLLIVQNESEWSWPGRIPRTHQHTQLASTCCSYSNEQRCHSSCVERDAHLQRRIDVATQRRQHAASAGRTRWCPHSGRNGRKIGKTCLSALHKKRCLPFLLKFCHVTEEQQHQQSRILISYVWTMFNCVG